MLSDENPRSQIPNPKKDDASRRSGQGACNGGEEPENDGRRWLPAVFGVVVACAALALAATLFDVDRHDSISYHSRAIALLDGRLGQIGGYQAYTHRWGTYVPQAAVYWVAGKSMAASVAFPMAVALGLAGLAYRWGARGSRWGGVFAVLGLASTPTWLTLATTLNKDTVLALWAGIALFLLDEPEESGGPGDGGVWRGVAAGIALGMADLSCMSALSFAPGFAACLGWQVWRGHRRRPTATALAVAVGCVLAVWTGCWLAFGDPWVRERVGSGAITHLHEISEEPGWAAAAGRFAWLPLRLFSPWADSGVLAWFALPALVAALRGGRRALPAVAVVVFLLTASWLRMTKVPPLERFLTHLLAPLAGMAGGWIGGALERGGRSGTRVSAFFVALVLATVPCTLLRVPPYQSTTAPLVAAARAASFDPSPVLTDRSQRERDALARVAEWYLSSIVEVRALDAASPPDGAWLLAEANTLYRREDLVGRLEAHAHFRANPYPAALGPLGGLLEWCRYSVLGRTPAPREVLLLARATPLR
ncbi:MAG: hypothetical protein HYZ53_31110 [Planctomycetes bacterium]|nr:hypothetical protein [Planctomycetota bacterium]